MRKPPTEDLKSVRYLSSSSQVHSDTSVYASIGQLCSFNLQHLATLP